MMKLPVILLLLFAQIASAQQRRVSYSEIDDRAKMIDFAPPAELAFALTKDYTTENEKLRSIFSWITEHISYRVKKNYQSIRAGYGNRPPVKDTGQWKSGNDVMAETVLQNKSAVCDGYARLFKTLCDYAGLRSAIISGFANGDYNRHAKFRCNHTWNAIYIDSSWHLLDLTWASGYTNYRGDEFFKRTDETYFLARPEVFIRDHFPDDVRWTLLDKPVVPDEFGAAPYHNRAFSKYRIVSVMPGTGIIEAAPGDTVQITLETTDPLADSKIHADTIPDFDAALQKSISTVAIVQPSVYGDNKKLSHYRYLVQDNGTEWLHIIYNQDAILRYRLRIKKDLSAVLPMVTKPIFPVTAYP